MDECDEPICDAELACECDVNRGGEHMVKDKPEVDVESVVIDVDVDVAEVFGNCCMATAAAAAAAAAVAACCCAAMAKCICCRCCGCISADDE